MRMSWRDWRAYRDAILQLATLTVGAVSPLPTDKRRFKGENPRWGDRGFRGSAIEQGDAIDRPIPG
jgi:hypothetical protein